MISQLKLMAKAPKDKEEASDESGEELEEAFSELADCLGIPEKKRAKAMEALATFVHICADEDY